MPESASGIYPRAVRKRFDRVAARYGAAAKLDAEIGARMLERLDYVRLAPRRILDAGSGPAQRALGKRYRDAQVIALDVSLAMLRAGRPRFDFVRRNPPRLLCGDLGRIPLAAGTVDLVWSNMALHWAGDPLAALREFHRVLAVEGLLMLSTLGPDTLKELRAAAGAGRVHRFLDMHDLGDMLAAAGFAAPVMDMEIISLNFRGADALLAELRATGQTSTLAARPRGLGGARFLRALRAALAAQMREGSLAATYEVLYGHAWKGAPRRAADGRAIVQFERRR